MEEKHVGHFLTLEPYSRDYLEDVLAVTEQLKNDESHGYSLKNRNLVMLFQKRSTRTRLSFEIGMNQLDGNSVFLSKEDIQLGGKQ